MKTITKITVVSVVLVILSVVMAEKSVMALEVFTGTSINHHGGVTDKGRTVFHPGEEVILMMEGYPLFGAEVRIILYDSRGHKIGDYTGHMDGGSGRQYVYLKANVNNIGYPDNFTADFYFRHQKIRHLHIRTVGSR